MLDENAKDKKPMTVAGMVLAIIATDFGFGNSITGYNQMGYASIIWYVLCAFVYLLPLAVIFSEYSGAVKVDHGGFYSWLLNSVGEKWAFIGTFMWIGLWVISMLQIVSGLGIHISGLFLGHDTSQTWHFAFLNSNDIEALIGAAFMVFSIFLVTRGFHKVAMIAMVSGAISLFVIGLFAVISVVIFFAHHGQLAQPMHGISSFVKSPNVQFRSPIAVMSFAVYAMFAYGGLEATSGFLDRMKNPRKEFPRAMLITAFSMMALYVFGILICGLATKWAVVFKNPKVNLYNNAFYMMANAGDSLAKAFGWSAATGTSIGDGLVRLLSIGALIPTLGLVAVVSYSPIKGLIAGSSKDLWPKKIATFNKHDMPSCALWIECAVIACTLVLIALTGKNGQQFYQIIVDMNNIGVIALYTFIAIAFVAFKKRKDLDRPIVFLHSMKSVYWMVGVLLTAMGLATLFNLINPLMQGQYNVAFWTFAGPVLFFFLSAFMYHLGVLHRAHRMVSDNLTYEKHHTVKL